MSRTQWWSLTALLAVVVGLLCGPAAASAAERGAFAPAVSVAQTQTQDLAQAQMQSPSPAPVPSPAQAQAQSPAPAPAPVVEAAGAGAPVPGCGKLRDHDGEPAVPTRARTAYDQAPGLAPGGLPAATGALPAEPPPGIRAGAPVPATPTPVELSVLRV
ncbi:hypothetical protein [Streptomyces sp. NPDC048142]|uniref:hypothetical protein n=1 Tax=Streptomyces sp. NPDC048142 TaxID=3365501 RepID=UPI00371F41C1